MSIDIDRSLLESQLNQIRHAVDNSTDGSILSTCVYIWYKEGEGILFRRTDRHTMGQLLLSAQEEGLKMDGEKVIMVELDRLREWVKNVFDERVRLDLMDDEGDQLKAVCGDAEGHFRTFDPNKFPGYKSKREDAECDFECTVGDFLNIMNFVSPFVGESYGSDPSNQYKVAQMEGKRAMGTDSRVLAIYKSDHIEVDRLKAADDELVVMERFLRRVDDDLPMTFSQSDTMSFIDVDGGSYTFGYTNPISSFPNTAKVPVDIIEEDVWSIPLESSMKAIKALSATSSEEDDELTVHVHGMDNEATMTFSMRDASEKTSSSIDLCCDRVEGEGEKTFRLNAQSLEQSLNLFEDNPLQVAFTDRYFKIREERDNGDIRVSLVTLRTDS
jgi:hypothetical protein